MYLILKVSSRSIWIKKVQGCGSTFISRHTLVKKAVLLHKMARVPFDLDLAVDSKSNGCNESVSMANKNICMYGR